MSKFSKTLLENLKEVIVTAINEPLLNFYKDQLYKILAYTQMIQSKIEDLEITKEFFNEEAKKLPTELAALNIKCNLRQVLQEDYDDELKEQITAFGDKELLLLEMKENILKDNDTIRNDITKLIDICKDVKFQETLHTIRILEFINEETIVKKELIVVPQNACKDDIMEIATARLNKDWEKTGFDHVQVRVSYKFDFDIIPSGLSIME